MLKTILLVSISAAAGVLLSISTAVFRPAERQVPTATRQVIVTVTEGGVSTVFTVPLTGSDRCGDVEERMRERSHNLQVCSEDVDVYSVSLHRSTTADGEHIERKFRSRVRVAVGEMIQFAKAERGKTGISATLAVR